MHLIQILLPLQPTPENKAGLERTRRELIDRCQGVTAYVRSPARGAWLAPDGTEEHDDVVMVEVLDDHFDRDHWRGYARQLAGRFGQKEVHVRALPVLVP
jgi:hypothetical protein